VYIPSSPPGVAVGPVMNLVTGLHHDVVIFFAGPDRSRCRHNTGG
jgi:hypothetical protein